MAKPRLFFTMPSRAISDTRLSALDCRVLGCVSMHDGMSLMKGTGAGCYASNMTLAGTIGCDYTSLSKSLSRLREFGYIVVSRKSGDRRMTTYRVIFEVSDAVRINRLSSPEIVVDMANQSDEIVGQPDEIHPKVVGREFVETRTNQPKTQQHYIPLKRELDSVETLEIDSVETLEINSVEAACLEAPKFVRGKQSLPDHAEMARLSRALKNGSVDEKDIPDIMDWLFKVMEQNDGEAAGFQATRLVNGIMDGAQYALEDDLASDADSSLTWGG